MSKLRTAMLAGLLAASLAPLYGCGSECGPGTVDKDGQCIVDAKGCAEGTILKDGECLLDQSGCGEGTMLDGALCVPIDTVCEAGTTFDQGSYTCVPDTDVICGDGTEVADDGLCVPSAEACDGTATLDDAGRCVVGAAACGAGTELDPNTGECMLADAACGQGTALDGDTGACVPTADVCDTGTKFDADSGLCLPDSCSPGDVVIDGVCTSPADDLAGDVDLTETEPNDPAFGGTAESLFVPTAGDDPQVFSGTISEATDLDGDGTVDQDVDVYEFTANAGEWFEISVLSTGMPDPAFKVEGPNGYVRWSPFGGGDAVRDVVIPEDGTYTVTVLPAMVLESDGEISRIGGDDWSYVGTFETLSAPSATLVDLSTGAGQLAGDFPNVEDNFFELSGAQAGDIVTVSVDALGTDAEGVVQVWSDATTLVSSQPLGPNTLVELDGTDASQFILIDWMKTSGASVNFELTADITGSSTIATIQPGGTHTFTVTAQEFDQIVASQTNPTSADLDVTITEVATGTELASETLASDSQINPLVTSAGDYEVVFTNNTSSNVDATLVAKAQPLPTIGPLAPGDSDTYTHPSTVPADQTSLVRLIVNEPSVLEFSGPYSGDMNFGLYDSTMTAINARPYTDDAFTYYHSLSPGTYFIEAEALDALTAFEVTVARPDLPSDNASSPGIAVTSNNTVTDTMTVSGCANIASLRVYVLIPHTYIGDLLVTLESPSGTSVTLHDETGYGDDDIIGWYPTDLTVDGPGALSDFAGEDANGDWTLSITDNAGGDDGSLVHWALDLTCQ
ncbi:proprotein convertase P-domain-containing protein [Persicimonas caeni]|nr:proprotein convertase P-domain-containing protein [Persicimonas caeni]